MAIIYSLLKNIFYITRQYSTHKIFNTLLQNVTFAIVDDGIVGYINVVFLYWGVYE